MVTERERAEQRESAFGKLEKTIADREQAAGARQRLGELQDVAERLWDDPFAQNQRLRKAFRKGRHERERETAKADELKERMGLGIELLPETEEDAKRAALVDFGSAGTGEDAGVGKALARPLFGSGQNQNEKKHHDNGPTNGKRKLKSELAASRARENLVSEIIGNTRASRDPFLGFASKETTPRGPVLLPGIKRKRAPGEAPDPSPSTPNDAGAPKESVPNENSEPDAPAGTAALVGYDSDSD
ncbi:hypothetical protein BT67DRAFT_441314 [Trichocladium antarcticum]|uniref:Uncharacterized protein n=1 Tax=Trichocladium antarcticum TaxID=1450529 RepID=A0AAN6ZEK9_9PEZI|nr:hypothetical protein BT67DRAFT_441314 [Trichocladium antarcticum]